MSNHAPTGMVAGGWVSKGKTENNKHVLIQPAEAWKGKAYKFARRTLLDKMDPADTFLAIMPPTTASYQ